MGRVLLILVLAAMCGCRSQPTKVIRVRVSADEQFRARANWKDLATARIAAANRLFEPMGVRWELSITQEWTVDPANSVEVSRRQLGGYIGQNAVALGIVTGPRGDAMGAATPIDPRLVVVDQPGKPESFNELVLAHHFGILMGAWPSSDAASFMHVPPGQGPDKTAAAVLKITRDADVLKGVPGLSKETQAALDKLWKESKAPAGTHPLALYFSHIGDELLARSEPTSAIEPLSQAAVWQPNDAKIHMSLGVAQAATQRFPAAAAEFRKVTELDPKSVHAFNALGGVLANIRKWDESADAFRKAVELAPNEAQYHANLGLALINIPAKVSEGIAELRTADRLEPGNANVAKALQIAQQRAGAVVADDGGQKTAPKAKKAKRGR